MWPRTSPPCPPPLQDSVAPPAAPHNPTSAPPLWSWTQRHLPPPHPPHRRHPPAALRRPCCPSTTNRSRTRASSGSAWSALVTETSTRAYWWGPGCFATPEFLVSAGFFFKFDLLLQFLKKESQRDIGCSRYCSIFCLSLAVQKHLVHDWKFDLIQIFTVKFDLPFYML